MKGRESGMPEETYWASFFDAEAVIKKLFAAEAVAGNLVEFGCGYGTFTLPAAKRVQGIVTALDIEPSMVNCLRQKAIHLGLTNVRSELRDFVAQGTGLADASQSHVMIFNLLHLEQPVTLLREAHRVLKPHGTMSVMHWRSDILTPRGPSLEIRPRPDQCAAWMEEAGFLNVEPIDLLDCCPYHFALLATR